MKNSLKRMHYYGIAMFDVLFITFIYIYFHFDIRCKMFDYSMLWFIFHFWQILLVPLVFYNNIFIVNNFVGSLSATLSQYNKCSSALEKSYTFWYWIYIYFIIECIVKRCLISQNVTTTLSKAVKQDNRSLV